MVAVLLVVAGAGTWDELFARALWLPSLTMVLITLRLMDDLGSIERDRSKKPVPIHAAHADAGPLRKFLSVLAVMSLVLTLPLRDFVATAGMVGVVTCYHIAYLVWPERSWTSNRHVWVHLKYPILALLVALPIGAGDVGGACIVFALFGVFELVDEPKFYRDKSRVVFAGLYGALLAFALVLRGDPTQGEEALKEALVAAVAAIAFGIGVRGQKGVGRTLKYLPFAVGLLSLLISGNRVPG